MFVEQLVKILAQNKVGVIGQSLFAHALPQEAKSGVMVTSGGIDIDHELRDFYQDSMLIVVRETSIGLALKKSDEIMALMPIMETVIDTVTFRFVRPLQLPAVFPRNDAALFEMAIPVEFAAHLL